ncbi:sigma-54 interaction domain-containing protein [Sphingoaurantiacus capsulatus]|uniref:Sigma-54 interaction domain-containing protein n=1 Tax=Sphingoaurantiacus capsulatus TaxID=1771310 RepID=A0ABV7XF74_9SPHN
MYGSQAQEVQGFDRDGGAPAWPREASLALVAEHRPTIREARATLESTLIGDSLAMQEVRHLIRQVAKSDASVIVTGPTGSGKEVIANAIHRESPRAAQPFVAVNTGAIPRDLLESELFGHEKGSFTGAINQRRGRFEEADGGTLFLDEIGDMPIDMQVKLLRVLEARSVQRVGGRGQIAVDTRIVSATHRDIDAAIEEQRFRADLFFRLAVFPIDLPSLAERREDVPQLVRHFVALSNAKLSFNQAAIERMANHEWPGNVRELRNVIDRAAIMFGGQVIGAEQAEMLLAPRGRRLAAGIATAAEPVAAPIDGQRDARSLLTDLASRLGAEPADMDAPLIGEEPVDLRTTVADIEQRYITEALRAADGVVAEAARLLSLQRTTLIEKMRKHGLKAA